MNYCLALFVAVVAFSTSGNAVNLVEKATELGATTLVTYLESAGLKDTIAGIADATVFGPTNEAFDALPQATKDALTSNATMLQQVLKYHVIGSRVMSSALSNEQLAASLDGRDIRINIYGTGNSQVITASGSQVTAADQTADNGVIHVLNRVMLPPNGNLVDFAVANGFSTLVTAVTTADLQGVLSGNGPFTLFAPTNAAFAKLPSGALDELLADKAKLTQVLQYHVVSNTYYSVSLSNGQMVPTLLGKSLTVTIDGANVKINDATVVTANEIVTNGVIHAIDTVLLPPEDMTTPNPSSGAHASAGFLTMAIILISTLF